MAGRLLPSKKREFFRHSRPFFPSFRLFFFVIPAKAGIPLSLATPGIAKEREARGLYCGIPAFAGMTRRGAE